MKSRQIATLLTASLQFGDYAQFGHDTQNYIDANLADPFNEDAREIINEMQGLGLDPFSLEGMKIYVAYLGIASDPTSPAEALREVIGISEVINANVFDNFQEYQSFRANGLELQPHHCNRIAALTGTKAALWDQIEKNYRKSTAEPFI